jgi:hypothetical protein
MEVSGEIHSLGALPSEEEPQGRIAQECEALKVGLEAMEKRKISHLLEIEHQPSSTYPVSIRQNYPGSYVK